MIEDIIEDIIKNVLMALYQSFGFALMNTFFFMFFYLYTKDHGWKESLRKWLHEFRSSSYFRKLFALAVYSFMILFRTLFNRAVWVNPLSEVLGGWGLYNSKGELTTESIENIILFIPFVYLLLWSFSEKKRKPHNFRTCLSSAFSFTFVFSVAIEFTQLFLKVGSFQLSDIFYNTLGGTIGGLIYYLCTKLQRKKDEPSVDEKKG